MKFFYYSTLVAGLLIIAGCKSTMFGSASNLNKPAAVDLNLVERFRQSRDDENGSIRPASFETIAQETPQQLSPPGRVTVEDYLKRGHIAGRQGRIDEAKKFYDLVLRTDPDNVAANHRLAVIADKQQNFPTAERHYLTALRHRANDSDLLADIGYSYFLQNRFEESEQYLSKALKSNPSHLRTLNNLGLLYGTLGDYDRALEMLRRTGSESEAREKLAKIFPRAKSHMPNSDINPANAMFASAGDTSNRSPVSSQFPSDSQLSIPLASRELTAPNPRSFFSRNSPAANPQFDQFLDGRELSSLHQNNYDATRTAGNSANPLRPVDPATLNPNGGFLGGINVSWPQPETQPPGTTRLQPNQMMPQQYQPLNTFPQPIPTDVRPVQETAALSNRLLPAPAHAAGQTQFPNGGFTNFGKQNSYNTTSGSYNEPVNQMNPVNNGYPEYQDQQPFTNWGNPNPNGSHFNTPAKDLSFNQLPSYNQFGTAIPNQLQGNQYLPQPTSDYSASAFQFQEFQIGQTGNGLTAGVPNTTGNQTEAFRLYEQRRRRQNAFTKTVQQFPQTVPQQQPRMTPAWP